MSISVRRRVLPQNFYSSLLRELSMEGSIAGQEHLRKNPGTEHNATLTRTGGLFRYSSVFLGVRGHWNRLPLSQKVPK